MSSTITMNHIGYLSAPNWVGEEGLLLEYPVIYSAIASSDTVRVLRVPVVDMRTKLPPDVLKKMERNLWPRMQYLKERLLEIHEARNYIASLDKNT